MTWRSLISTSVGAAIVAVVGITVATPSPAEARRNCGPYTGQMCQKTCLEECQNSPNCCDEIYRYYEVEPE